MPTATYLADRALELLTASEASLTLARTGNPVPSRNYRTHAPPVAETCIDDGQLCVYVANPAIVTEAVSQPVAQNVGGKLWLPYGVLVAEVWRCAPSGTPPASTALDAFAAAMMRDGWALVTGLEQAKIAGSLFAGLPPLYGPELGPLVPLPIQGGAGGWRMTVKFPLADAGPTI